MASPSVSVVIPAFNAARTLAATVQSALTQTLPKVEVLIVDDGSRDATRQVAESINDPRVRILSQENSGAAAARNHGMRLAAAPLVALLDADDLWRPEKLERQVAFLDANPTVGAVQTGVQFVNDAMEILEERCCTDTGNAYEECLRFQNLPGFASTLLARKDALERVGFMDERLVILEDWDLATRLAKHCGLRSIPEPLALYRLHPGNRSRNVDLHIAPGFLSLQRLFPEGVESSGASRHRAIAYGSFFRMLCGGYVQQKHWLAAARWGLKALRADPRQATYMARWPIRAIRRLATRRAGRHAGGSA